MIVSGPVILSEIIPSDGIFPNNPRLPVLLYKHVLTQSDPEFIVDLFEKNRWRSAWTNSIYTFHHYHSNTHEVLGIAEGSCLVQLGGEKGTLFVLEKGDVLILPAGISHKNLRNEIDFTCVGAYPEGVEYDMHYGKIGEHDETKKTIQDVPLPQTDPVYGPDGPLFKYWKK